MLRFERADGGERMAPSWTCGLDDPDVRAGLGERGHEELLHEVALLDTAGTPFDNEAFLAGQLSPVFFGSAMTNFGLEPFLDRFVDLAPPPRPRQSSTGTVDADSDRFSGFVFKIQANMDPNHRDRVAFVRVCSGRFTRGVEVNHVRTGRPFTMSRTMQFLAQERITIDEALRGRHPRACGTAATCASATRLAEHASFEFEGVPRFSPEHFVQVTLKDPAQAKAAQEGARAAVRRGGGPALLRPPPAGARSDPGRGRRPAVRGHRASARVGVQGRNPPQAAALQVRALGGGRALRAGEDRTRPGRELRRRRRIPAHRAVRERLGPAKGDRGIPASAVPGGRTARSQRYASMT